MAYYPDLSPYEYFDRSGAAAELNVGWLERGHPFTHGHISESARSRIEALTLLSVHPTRGLHACDLCDQAGTVTYEVHGKSLLLGNAEIRAFGPGGKMFAAPNLLIHYVVCHNYLPPQEFLDAVVEGPSLAGDAYFRMLEKAGLNWTETLIASSEAEESVNLKVSYFRRKDAPEG